MGYIYSRVAIEVEIISKAAQSRKIILYVCVCVRVCARICVHVCLCVLQYITGSIHIVITTIFAPG